MRYLILLICLLATPAYAQCNGVFPANTVCGNFTTSTNLPKANSSGAIPQTFNVMAYGAKCDGTTDDTTAINNAVNAALTAKGVVYFPGNVTCFTASGITITNAADITIGSDSFGPNVPVLKASGTAALTLTGVAAGNCHNVILSHFRIEQVSGNFPALQLLNCIFFTLDTITAQSIAGIGVLMEAASNFSVITPEFYGAAALQISDSVSGTFSGSGVGTFTGGQYTSTSGGSPAIILTGGYFSVAFIGGMYEANGGTSGTSVQIDGADLGGANLSSVDFYNMHGESNFNLAQTASDYLVGAFFKAGHVGIHNNTNWGDGMPTSPGTESQRDFVRLVSAVDIQIDGDIAWTGYTRALVRVESGCCDHLDVQRLYGLSIAGAYYSDANGVIPSGWTDSVHKGQSFVSTSITTPQINGPAGANLVMNAPSTFWDVFAINTTDYLVLDTAALLPFTSNQLSLGQTANVWTDTYTYKVTSPGLSYANANAAPAAGDIAMINDAATGNCGDSACTAFGTAVTGGGGSLKKLIWYNGSGWTLIGK